MLTLEQIEVAKWALKGMLNGLGHDETIDQLCTLASERLQTGTFAEGIEAAAKVVEENAVIESAGGNELRKRYDGDVHSMHYAVAIRNLKQEQKP